MIRATAAFLTMCLFLWVLPMGHFIRPAQEKTACGGGRAMHMCTMGMGKMHADTGRSSKISFNDPSGVEKGPRSASSGAANDMFYAPLPCREVDGGLRSAHYSISVEYTCWLSISSPPPKSLPLI